MWDHHECKDTGCYTYPKPKTYTYKIRKIVSIVALNVYCFKNRYIYAMDRMDMKNVARLSVRKMRFLPPVVRSCLLERYT